MNRREVINAPTGMSDNTCAAVSAKSTRQRHGDSVVLS
jgi:hypothetical protein